MKTIGKPFPPFFSFFELQVEAELVLVKINDSVVLHFLSPKKVKTRAKANLLAKHFSKHGNHAMHLIYLIVFKLMGV